MGTYKIVYRDEAGIDRKAFTTLEDGATIEENLKRRHEPEKLRILSELIAKDKKLRNVIKKVEKQIEKLVDVLKAFSLSTDDIIHQEIALYKVATEVLTSSNEIEGMVRKHNARILEVTPDYTVIEKTGHKAETQELFESLNRFGVLQFTRSGRVAITKLKQEYFTGLPCRRV